MDKNDLMSKHWLRKEGHHEHNNAGNGLGKWQHDIEKFFQRIWNDSDDHELAKNMDDKDIKALSAFSPKVDINETEKEYKVTAEIPGVSEEDVSAELLDKCLVISGEKRDEKEESDNNYHYKECSYGKFKRTLSLPEDVDASKIKAKFDKGVMTVTIPKLSKERRKIDIEK